MIGVSELTTSAAEHGDVNATTGSKTAVDLNKFSISVTGTTDPKLMTQVILTPIIHEKVYGFDVWSDSKKAWETVPAKARSRTYQPVPAVTTKELPRGSEVKPEAKPKLDTAGVQEGADEVKKLRALRDKAKDDKEKAAIDAQIEGKLAGQREALEDVVRKAHPSLEVIDRTKNIYKVMIAVANSSSQSPGMHQQPFVGTLESLMDFAPRSPAVQNAADALQTKDTNSSDGVSIQSQAGLGGTGAQGRVNPYPGDVDLSETIKITAPTADAAAAAFASSIQSTVTTATKKPTDGSLGYMFLGMMVGVYPSGAKDEGKPISWTHDETVAGSKSFKGKDGKLHTITLAQAVAAPSQSRAANTYWRGPIDGSGTYGEITKVLSYEAVTAAGGALFSTPKIGQGFQEVGFGDRALSNDTERAKLLEALGPQIEKYAKEGMWVKALKRAYTVARMLNDVKALNDFGVLVGGEQAELKTVSEHATNFSEDIVNSKGIAKDALSAPAALQQAKNLSSRIHAIETVGPKAAGEMDKAIGLAGDDIRGNEKAHSHIHHHVLKPLDAALAGDKKYATSVATALRMHGYLRDK